MICDACGKSFERRGCTAELDLIRKLGLCPDCGKSGIWGEGTPPGAKPEDPKEPYLLTVKILGYRPVWATCKDFAEASALTRGAIEAAGVGGSKFGGAKIRDVQTKKVVAVVSYNGRVWSPKKWEPGDKPIWDPSSRGLR